MHMLNNHSFKKFSFYTWILINLVLLGFSEKCSCSSSYTILYSSNPKNVHIKDSESWVSFLILAKGPLLAKAVNWKRWKWAIHNWNSSETKGVRGGAKLTGNKRWMHWIPFLLHYSKTHNCVKRRSCVEGTRLGEKRHT